MELFLELRRRGRQVAGSFFGGILVAYFLFHMVQGERGLFAWVQLNQQIDQKERENKHLQAERVAWENKIKLMRTDSLDADLLDERVRLMMGFSNKDEAVIFLNGKL
ncbi:MAG: septum formation initiator family protein [Pseudomonadota bacterium]|nr:septum formation initiator family protein [Pseudomonadota bacterium]